MGIATDSLDISCSGRDPATMDGVSGGHGLLRNGLPSKKSVDRSHRPLKAPKKGRFDPPSPYPAEKALPRTCNSFVIPPPFPPMTSSRSHEMIWLRDSHHRVPG